MDGTYEVALKEISYTFSWLNVQQDIDCTFVDPDGKVVVDSFRLVNRGQYSTAARLISEINNNLKNADNPGIKFTPSFSLQKFTQTMKVNAGFSKDDRSIYPITNKNREDYRRRRRREVKNHNKPVRGDHGIDEQGGDESDHEELVADEADNSLIIDSNEELDSTSFKNIIQTMIKGEQHFLDLTSNLRTIFVHSNIVEHSIVGERYEQLLRTVKVPFNAQPNDQINFEDPDPIFHTLNTNYISQIDIRLTDDSGNKIPFQDGGESRVTLLFRRRLQ